MLYGYKISRAIKLSISFNKKLKELEGKQPALTLEPTKKVFLEASRAAKEFLNGDEAKKKEVIEIVLWNLSIKEKKVASIKFKKGLEKVYKVDKNAPISILRCVSV